MNSKDFDTNDFDQVEIEQADKSLTQDLLDFTHKPDIQSQIAEAFYIWKNDPELIEEDIEQDIDDVTFTKFMDWFIHDFKTLNERQRVIELFKESFEKPLTPAESYLIDSWINSVHSYFETISVSKNESVTIKDLFSGATLTVHDKSSSNQVGVSEILAARPLKTGNKVYFSGVVNIFPQNFKSVILKRFSEEFTEYKDSVDPDPKFDTFLRDRGFYIAHHLEEMMNDPYFVSSDGSELVFATAEYNISDPMEVLDSIYDMDRVSELSGGSDEIRIFSWSDENGADLKGSFELEPAKLTIRCHSRVLLGEAKEMMETRLGALIEFANEWTDEPISKPGTKKAKKSSKRTKLPSGVKSKKELNNVLDEYYQSWIDTPHESLEGKTPRQSLQTPEGKVQVAGLLKDLKVFYNRAKERGEPFYEIDKLTKRLRLDTL